MRLGQDRVSLGGPWGTDGCSKEAMGQEWSPGVCSMRVTLTFLGR